MKYTNYFRGMMMVSLFFLGCAVEAYLETSPTICAITSVISFVLWFSGIMAPDPQKYTMEYLKKYKGWS
jgi:hypothetical protein